MPSLYRRVNTIRTYLLQLRCGFVSCYSVSAQAAATDKLPMKDRLTARPVE